MTQQGPAYYDQQGNPIVNDDPVALTSALRAGKVAVPKGSTVPMRDESGVLYDVPVSQVNAVDPTWRVASNDELAAEARAKAEAESTKLREERQGTGLGLMERAGAAAKLAGMSVLLPGGIATALATGTGREALADTGAGSASDAAYVQGRDDAWSMGLGKNVRKQAIGLLYGKDAADKYVTESKLAREAHPEAYTRGQVEGGVESGVASGVVGNGVGGLARLASGAGLAPEAAGALMQAGMEGVLPAATTVAGHAIKGAVTMGARGAVEGAIAAGTSELSEQMFGDPEINGEKIFLAAGKGALMGAATGAVLGGATEGIGALRAARKAAEIPVEWDIPVGTPTKPTMAENFAADQAWHGANAGKGVAKVVDKKLPGGTRALGEEMLSEGIVPKDPVEAMKWTAAKSYDKAVERLDYWGQRIGEIRGGVPVEAPGSTVGEQVRAAAKEIKGGAMADARAKLMGLADDIDKSLGVVRAKDGTLLDDPMVSLKQMAEERIALQKRAGFEKLSPTVGQEAFQSARAKMAEAEFAALDAAAKDAGSPETLSVLKAANDKYRKLSYIVDALEESEGRRAGNNFFSPRDVFAAGTAVASGHGLLSIPAALGTKFLRERGNFIAAATLTKLNDFAKTQRAIQTADRMLEQAAEGASGVQTHPYRSPALPSGSLQKQYEAAAAHVTQLAMNQQRAAQAAADEASMGHAPKIGEHYAAAISRTASTLAAMLPQRPAETPLSKPRPSTTEMRQFVTAYQTAMHPEAAVKKIAAGSMDPAVTKMLAASAPKTFEKLRSDVQDKYLQRIQDGHKPHPDELMKLHLAFGITIDPTLTPKALYLQGQAAASPAEPPGPGPKRTRPINLDHLTEKTGTDRLER